MSAKFAVWCDQQIENILSPKRNDCLTLTKPQENAIKAIVQQRAHEFPRGKERTTAFKKIHNAIHAAFHVGSYKDIPEQEFNSVIEFVDNYVFEGELLEKQDDLDLKVQFPLETAKPLYGDHMTYSELMRHDRVDPLLELIKEEHHTGRNVDGCFESYQAHRELLRCYHDSLDGINHYSKVQSIGKPFGKFNGHL